MTWAPPPSDTSYAVPGVSGLRFADVGPRLVAWIIDILILGLIGSGVSLAMSAVFGTTVDWTAMLTNPEAAFEGDMYTRMVLVTFIGTLIATAIDFTYFVVLWSSEGRATLGMRLLKLQVGNAADGRTLTRPQAFKRWLVMGNWLDLLSALPLVGGLIAVGQLAWYVVLLITTANSPTRQGLHDRSAGTAIVQPSGGSGNGMLMGCVVIIGILVVMSLVSMVALVFLGSQVSTILEEVGNSI